MAGKSVFANPYPHQMCWWQYNVLQKVPRDLRAEQRVVQSPHSLPEVPGHHPKLPVHPQVQFSWKWEIGKEALADICVCGNWKATYRRLYLGSLQISLKEHYAIYNYITIYSIPYTIYYTICNYIMYKHLVFFQHTYRSHSLNSWSWKSRGIDAEWDQSPMSLW